MFDFIKIKKQSGGIFLLCFFYYLISPAQVNLIPNPSFEDSIAIPNADTEFNKCKDWYAIAGTPDYFSIYSPANLSIPFASVKIPNNCFGYQNAKQGNYYSGIFTRAGYNPLAPYFSWRECMGIKLSQKLLAGHSYKFTMFISLSDFSGYSCNQIQAYFTANQFTVSTGYDTTSNNLNFQIQNNTFNIDTANWIPISGCFLAVGGEEYLSIGNFKDALHTSTIAVNSSSTACSNYQKMYDNSYYYIDDVSLYDMGLYTGPATCVNDTLICNGTSLSISNNIKDSSVVSWFPPTALSCSNCPNPVATPTTTTLYYVNKSICGASSKDSILVTVHTPTTTINAGLDKNICPNEIVNLGTQDSTAFVNYNWQFIGNSSLSCTTCATPLANVQQSTEFILQRNECGITSSDTVKVTVDFCDILIPNVFTPNADGINDVWKFKLPTGAKLNELTIYDRWGLLMYAINSDQLPLKSETTALNLQWDGYTTAGIACSEGVYFYTLTYTDKKGEVIKMKGYVSLFR